MKKIQASVAAALSLLGVMALAGVVHLVYIFPRTMATWAAEGRALSVAEQMLADLSNLCRAFGLLLMSVLFLVIIGCGVWAVLAGMGSRQ